MYVAVFCKLVVIVDSEEDFADGGTNLLAVQTDGAQGAVDPLHLVVVVNRRAQGSSATTTESAGC